MKVRYCLLAVLLLLPIVLFGQALRLTPTNPSVASTFLNAQLAADTVANNGIPAGRVYVLTRGAQYLANAIFRVNAGQTLKLQANDSAGVGRPVVYLFPTGTGGTPQNPPGNFIDLRGNMEMRNVVLTGYFELVDTNLNNLQGGLINVPTAGAGANITIDSCILTNSNGNHIRTDGAPKNVKVTNSVFANMGYLGRSNLGAGKGFDFRDVSVDTVLLENNTFVNWQDRVVRHYNFANPLAGTGSFKYIKINHNTFVNGMSYHGFLNLGSMGNRGIFTNNLMLDPFSLGNDTDATRQAEFLNSAEKDAFGAARINWIFSAPNDTTVWQISNNYYAISDSGQAFFTAFASAGVSEGSPLTWHINSKIADSVNAFKKITLTMTNIPKPMNKINRWYRDPTGGNKTKNTPSAAWNSTFDFDRRGWQYFRDTLNCSYSTSSTAYTGGVKGFPVGDLNWFPSKLSQYLVTDVAQEGSVLPEEFSLQQNYPNPFNPSTKIVYSLPHETRVTLEVFDLIGRKVATLVNETKRAGTYSVDFDGSRFVSGVYFYRLSTPQHVYTNKMLLIK